VIDQAEPFAILRNGLHSLGIAHTETILNSFRIFLEELLLWNKKTNLVGTSDQREIITRHILDSLTVYDLLKNTKKSILDVGAGAGFPSIPLSIVERNMRISAVERRKKRAAFLKNISSMLCLEHYSVLERDIREVTAHYDIILSRGVGELALLYKLSKRVVKENALIIAFKGKITEINREMERLKESINDEDDLSLRVQKVKVPYLDEEERNIVIIETK